MEIEIKSIPLLNRILLLPRIFSLHYAISRKYCGRIASARIALSFSILAVTA